MTKVATTVDVSNILTLIFLNYVNMSKLGIVMALKASGVHQLL